MNNDINNNSLKCVRCNAELNSEDNFCWNCGDWTAKGYHLAKEGKNKNNETSRIQKKLYRLLLIFALGVLIFFGMNAFRGNDMYKPLFFIRRKVTNLIYGYNTSIISTNNVYLNQVIDDLEDAKEIIIKDSNSQKFKCSRDLSTDLLEYEIETDYDISSVNFCDITQEEAEKIKKVIDNMFTLFPNIKGALTNISITNSMTKGDYIAYFQPAYQFVNVNGYNKVNKSQILLNSYYFLNDDILENPVTDVTGENWYVNGATWESTLAHELGHYISFYTVLKENNMDNITLVTQENERLINEVLNEYTSGKHSKRIIDKAIDNYNTKYNDLIDMDSFACNISSYACAGDENNEIIYDEVIAEAIHDYYLHRSKAKPQSLEIVKIIKELME